ncbi:aminoimidazole riboside kinase [Ornithinibacillus halophilus]|uniref:Fructokinase n=1 Tax=Ornithinibacillus halophilus TaxID=930117 RepID=A0A1M5DZT4_9BACI|nr:aminoimidazole riboside kinase [Ornithinibacillus halophilus]SHF72450.1 fructokinase [Ornithinibacillus halophilus]
MKNGIISMGEALIDFIPTDHTNSTYFKSPGGAPANVAVGLARLGLPSLFLGMVGKDVLGSFLQNVLHNYGVDISQMQFSTDTRTGLVFVTNTEDGERSFDFYINPSADQKLSKTNINKELFETHKIFHFGSISLINNPIKEATKYAVELAEYNDMIISFDPNVRLSLWPDEEIAQETIISMLPKADILKVSEEELAFITGENRIEDGLEALEKYDIPLILVTLGAKGSYVHTKDGTVHIPALKVEAIDTTGAGDAYVSGILYSIHENHQSLEYLRLDEAEEMARFASISGALAASAKGAMTTLPTLDDVLKKLNDL